MIKTFKMIKKIQKWGNGLGIYFDTKEIQLLGLRNGDKVDLSDIFLIQATNIQKKEKKKC